MIKDAIALRKELEKYNEFWLTGKVKEAEKFPHKRFGFEELKNEIDLKHMTFLIGPRRVGKSVLLKHIINHIIRDADTRNVFYYSFEVPTISQYCENPIMDSFEYWYENIAKQGKKFFLVDEVHFIREWFKWLKAIYDRYDDVKIFVSGSSGISIQKDAIAYLKGRVIIHEIFPLTFREFLLLKDREIPKLDVKNIDEIDVRRICKQFKDDFKEYLLVGGLPEWFEVKDVDKWFKILTNMLTKKAIYEDIATLFGIKNTKILENIFSFMVANQSRILAYETINEVANLKHEILTNYIEYLKASYLIVEILKFAKIKEQLKSKKKYLCIDQGVRNATLLEYEIKEDNIGFIIENIVGLHLWYQSQKINTKLMYQRINDEIDFIFQKNKKNIPVEVKYRENIKDSDTHKLKDFMSKFDFEKGFILTKDLFKKEGTIWFIPVIFYLLYIYDDMTNLTVHSDSTVLM